MRSNQGEGKERMGKGRKEEERKGKESREKGGKWMEW